jgi:hypothetical protein
MTFSSFLQGDRYTYGHDLSHLRSGSLVRRHDLEDFAMNIVQLSLWQVKKRLPRRIPQRILRTRILVMAWPTTPQVARLASNKSSFIQLHNT